MAHKDPSLNRLTVRQLKARRRSLARVVVVDPQAALRGSLVMQERRCGREGCRCMEGQLHGPYVYLTVAREESGSRLLYVPAELADAVRERVELSARIEGALAEISDINLELLARRELD